MHGDAGGADGVALGFQPAGAVDRQAAVALRPAFQRRAGALAFGGEAHRLVFDQLGDGEAVMHLGEGEVGQPQLGVGQGAGPSLARALEAGDVAGGDGHQVVDLGGGAEAHGAARGARHVALGDHDGGGAVADQGAVGALQRPGDEGVLLALGAAELVAQILAHLRIGVVHAVLVVLRGDGGERVGLVAMLLEIGLGDAGEDAGEASLDAGLALEVGGGKQDLAHALAAHGGHLLHAHDEGDAAAPGAEEVQRAMDGGGAGGAGILEAGGGPEAQLRHRLEDQRGREVLLLEAVVVGAEEDRIHLMRLDAGIGDGLAGDEADQRLGVGRLLQLAEPAMRPADDGGVVSGHGSPPGFGAGYHGGRRGEAPSAALNELVVIFRAALA